mmetsp:Transcript_47337/g.101947  ORF Transcript_47337/g.101947 Transcript_47337/m.101947 type:complete len:519 (-) Transcript_47337:54-1610(-)
MGVSTDEGPQTPFAKLYYSDEMIRKYQPLVTALELMAETEGKDEEVRRDYEKHLKIYRGFEWCSNWDGKKYDIVIFGASGYTGYLTMEYLKRVALVNNPEPFTFALAGRTVSKVQEMRDREFGGTQWEDTPILQASFDDVVSCIDLAKSAHVIINLAGPYSLAQGEVLVDACCHVGTHYCDVSGELPWTLRTLDLYEQAKKGGALVSTSAATAGAIVDVLLFMCAKKAREDHGEELRRAINYQTGGGATATASGGTLASRNAMTQASDEARRKMADPFTLGGFIPQFDRNGMKDVLIEKGTGRCTAKVRKEESDAILNKMGECPYTGLWRVPTMYSFLNTRIVRRSNAMLANLENQPYGKEFNFQEFATLPPDMWKQQQQSSEQPTSKKAMSVEEEKAALEASGKYYKQGEGPPLEELTEAWIANLMWAQTTSGKEIKASYCGNDAYFETSRAAVEWAMTVRFDYDKLPHKGGVLNAAVSGQEPYAKRLIGSGAKVTLGKWLDWSELTPPGFASSRKQ